MIPAIPGPVPVPRNLRRTSSGREKRGAFPLLDSAGQLCYNTPGPAVMTVRRETKDIETEMGTV